MKDLERLETWLGEDHNLQLVREQTVIDRRLRRHPETIQLVSALSARRQETLRRAALKLGSRVFAQKPKAFIRSATAGRLRTASPRP